MTRRDCSVSVFQARLSNQPRAANTSENFSLIDSQLFKFLSCNQVFFDKTVDVGSVWSSTF